MKGLQSYVVPMSVYRIGRASGYKTTELQTLSDGEMLVIGGKEIEVMGVLSEEQFRNGTCFQLGVKEPELVVALPPLTAGNLQIVLLFLFVSLTLDLFSF